MKSVGWLLTTKLPKRADIRYLRVYAAYINVLLTNIRHDAPLADDVNDFFSYLVDIYRNFIVRDFLCLKPLFMTKATYWMQMKSF